MTDFDDLLEKALRRKRVYYQPSLGNPRSFGAQRVYFIDGGNGLVKIGVSVDVKARLAQLQATSPVQLKLIGVIPGNDGVERMIHAQFAKYRKHGEWFTCISQVRALLEHVKRRTPVNLALDLVEPRAPRRQRATNGKA